jgi:hypothetical protein
LTPYPDLHAHNFVRATFLISQNWTEQFRFSHGFLISAYYPRKWQRTSLTLPSISVRVHLPRIAVRFHRQSAFCLPKEVLHHCVISNNVNGIERRRDGHWPFALIKHWEKSPWPLDEDGYMIGWIKYMWSSFKTMIGAPERVLSNSRLLTIHSIFESCLVFDAESPLALSRVLNCRIQNWICRRCSAVRQSGCRPTVIVSLSGSFLHFSQQEHDYLFRNPHWIIYILLDIESKLLTRQWQPVTTVHTPVNDLKAIKKLYHCAMDVKKTASARVPSHPEIGIQVFCIIRCLIRNIDKTVWSWISERKATATFRKVKSEPMNCGYHLVISTRKENHRPEHLSRWAPE